MKTLLSIGVVVILLAVGTYYFFHAQDEEGSVAQSSYTNSTYHFSLSFPEQLLTKESTEDAFTVLFHTADNARSFQVYIAPIAEQEISQARFLRDAPSGVREEAHTISIDGTQAVAFYSTDSLVGEVYEIWFIKNGFLYEVTSYKELDTWLSEIMKSWRFI